MRNHLENHRGNRHNKLKSSSRIGDKASRIALYRVSVVASAGRPVLLTAGDAKSPKRKPPGIAIPCRCAHPKSIHARMYGNPKLGTSCNFPECRCKAYRPA